MRHLLFILSLVLLSSCGSHLVLSSDECKGQGMWSSSIENVDFEIKANVYTPFWLMGKSQVNLSRLLLANRIECEQVKEFNYTVKKDTFDLLKSIIPFWGTTTVILRGSLYRPTDIPTEEIFEWEKLPVLDPDMIQNI